MFDKIVNKYRIELLKKTFAMKLKRQDGGNKNVTKSYTIDFDKHKKGNETKYMYLSCFPKQNT